MVFVIHNGKRYVKDAKSGYYLCASNHKRLHRVIWEEANGEIPKGFHIHHKDHNKDNNALDNLELLSASEHMRRHTLERIANGDIDVKKNMQLRQEAAKKWHKSAEGRAWHSIHAKECAKKWIKVTKTCQMCGKEYEVVSSAVKKSKFCSNNCKSAWRKKLGVDNVVRVCLNCGEPFTTNKYSKTRFCSLSCGRRFQK